MSHLRAVIASCLLASACHAGPMRWLGSDVHEQVTHDAGTQDAGAHDAGQPDAGHDAGHDSGQLAQDAGSDAGGQIDPVLLPPGAPNHGIYLYWLLDDDSLSVAKDSSGNARDGALINAPSLSDPAPTTRVDNVRSRFLNGTGELASYTEDTALPELTLGFWLKPAAATPALVFTLRDAQNTALLAIAIGSAGAFELRSDAAAPGTACVAPGCVSSNAQAVDDTWVHVAITLSGTTAHLFVAGSDRGSLVLPASVAQPASLVFAAPADMSALSVRGNVDEVILYDWVLTPADLIALSAAP